MKRPRFLPELAVAAGLVVLAFLQEPGRIVRDTKLQAALDPGGLLASGLHLWDPSAAFGHVPNQAAGYLFPIAPLFSLGDALGLPPWVLQRLWIAGLLVAAFAGAVLLARELGIGTRGSRLVGGLAYALSPAVLSILGHQSAATTGFALLPLAVWPLVRGSVRGSPRRAAAASVLVVVAMGGANGASVAAVLVLPFLWLVTRPAGPRRRALLGWWAGGIALATLWWTGPLVLQGRYGLDFAAITETSALTTGTTSLAEVLRGAGTWTSYLVVGGRPWVPAGWSIATDELAIIGGSLVAALGLFGLARRDLPERLPFVLSLLLGASAMAAGWVGPFDGPLAETVRDVLDGPGAPLRNIHKFAPLVSLPVALGAAHALHRLASWWPATGRSRSAVRVAAAAVGAAAVVAGALPLVTGNLPLDGAFEEVPDHWQEAADWLDEHARGTRTLILPAASFGEYEWGRPFDEPLGSIADVDWAVRNLVPLGAPGSTRLLDAVEELLATGQPSAGLAPALARSGIGHVLVRNDLDLERVTSPPPAVVHHVLVGSPGLEPVARFGTPSLVELPSRRRAPGPSATAALAPVEVYEVAGAEPAAVAYAAGERLEVTGAPESLVALAASVPVDGRAVVEAEDEVPELATAPAQAIVTDGSQRRDVTYGRVHDRASYVLTAEEDAPGTDRAPETATEPDEAVTVASYPGLDGLRASSFAEGARRLPDAGPFAALDGDPVTSWRVSTNRPAVGQWIELTFDEPRFVDGLAIQLPAVRLGRGRITELRVATDLGVAEVDASGPGNRRRVVLPPGRTRRIRITITGVAGRAALETAGIAEIELPRFRPARVLRLPTVEGATAAVLERNRSDPYDLTRHDEEAGIDRLLTLEAATLQVEATATARPGPALLAELQRQLTGADVVVSASSVWGNLPEHAAWWAADGDPVTAWRSDPANPSPAVTLTVDGERTVNGIALTPSPSSRSIEVVEVEAGGVARRLTVDPEGVARFPATTTDEITVRFPVTEDHDPGSIVSLAEVGVLGLEGASAGTLDLTAPVAGGCSTVLGLEVDGRPVPLRVEGTVEDLLERDPIRVQGCRAVAVDEGEHRVVLPGSPILAVDTIALVPPRGGGPTSTGRDVEVLDWSTASRRVWVGAGPEALLAINEGFNRGWEAHVGGEDLVPIRLDGWRQGFVVPDGTEGTVELRFAPDGPHRLFLLAGLLGTLAVAVAALVRTRRTPPEVDRDPWRPPSWLVLVAVTALIALVGGVLALLTIPLWLLPDRSRTLPAVAALSYAVVGVSILVSPGPGGAGFDAGPQILAVLALAAVGLSLADEPSPAATAPPGRRTGTGPPAPGG